MKYRLTEKAAQDVMDLYMRGAAEFGVDQAERYAEGLVDAFELLADNPLLARERTEFQPPVRLHRYQAHMIVYKADGGAVLIIRVLHGRQDWEQHFP